MSLALRQLSTADTGFEADFQRLLHWSAETDAAIEGRVAQIIADVRARDAAVLELTARFDGLQVASMSALEIGRTSCAPRWVASRRRSARRWSRRPRACAATTSASATPAAKAGATAMPTARCWARRSRRWTGWASTCRVARRPIRPA